MHYYVTLVGQLLKQGRAAVSYQIKTMDVLLIKICYLCV
jgi:hypothetical protein